MDLTLIVLCRFCVLIWIWSGCTVTCAGQAMDYFYDPTFTPPNIIGGSSGTSASSVLVHSDGRYTIAGGFQFNWPYQIKKFVRFFHDGFIDESFSNNAEPMSPAFMQFYQNGYLYLGATSIGVMDFDGSHDPTLKFFALSFPPYSPSLPPSPKVNMYQILDDDRILVTGRFSPDTNNLEDRRHLVRIHPDGSPDTSFEPLKCEEPFHPILTQLYPTPDGKWVVTGEFNYIEGYESPNIARLNTDFTVDTTFKSPYPDHNWSVRIIKGSHPHKLHGAIDDQNRVYVRTINPNLSFPNPLMGLEHSRLLADGTIDTTFQVAELTFLDYFGETGEGGYYPGSIQSIVFEPDGSLIIGGRFRTVNGQPRGNIAMLNENGSLIENVFHRQGADTANWENGNNPDINVPAINSIVRLDNGGLMVGGRFSRYDGHDQWGLVRLMPSPVSVEEREENSGLVIYPNPASNWIQIANETVDGLQNIDIFDLSGQLVLSISSQNCSGMVDVSVLSAGIYVVKLQQFNKLLTGKFVKN